MSLCVCVGVGAGARVCESRLGLDLPLRGCPAECPAEQHIRISWLAGWLKLSASAAPAGILALNISCGATPPV